MFETKKEDLTQFVVTYQQTDLVGGYREDQTIEYPWLL